MEEPDDRIDIERLQAEHPSWRLFQAHPAVGLEETEGDYAPSVSSKQLGLRWLTLPLSEQEAREADFLRALLEIAARDEEARFEAIPLGKGESSEQIAARTGGRILDDGAVTGRLTAQAIDALVDSSRCFVVDRCARLAVVAAGSRAVCVWTDRWKAGDLEQELETAWWDRAQERERSRPGQDVQLRRKHAVDRELRARLMLTWERRSGLLVVAAFFASEALDWHPFGWWGTALAILVAGLVVATALGRLLERWYRSAAGGDPAGGDRQRMRAGGP